MPVKIIDRTGETNRANNGLLMTIIAYRNSRDIDILFEDGTVVYHKAYGSFLEGTVKHPVVHTKHSIKEFRIGETNTADCGLEMQIIAYRGIYDIDVRFEDGVIVTNKSYISFKQGWIKHPSYTRTALMTGKTRLAYCGILMSVEAYRNSKSIDVLFESGYFVSNAQYYKFQLGHIGHPFPYDMGQITIESPAYIHNNTGNFYCRCNKCGQRDIMTISEMKAHTCK